MLEMDLDKVDLTQSPPSTKDEAERQYYFMAKAKGYVTALAEELGRVPTCCVTTFGCPKVNVA